MKVSPSLTDLRESRSDYTLDARDLIRRILRTTPADRLTIPKILTHAWFTDEEPPLASPPPLDLNSTTVIPIQDTSSTSNAPPKSPEPIPSPQQVDFVTAVTDALREQIPFENREASESSSTTSDAHHSGTSDDHTDLTSATTPDAQSSPDVPLLALEQTASILEAGGVSRSGSQSTLGPNKDALRTQPASKLSLASKISDSTAFPTVAEIAEEAEDNEGRPPLPNLSRNGSLKGKGSVPPSAFPTRTPARTKRRSVSSTNISAPTSPTEPSFPAGAGAAPIGPQDYASLLTTSAPLLFSTPLERGLLTSLSTIGFDTGQIVHSVLTDACDSTGAIWWLLKKKAERREVAESRRIAEERRKTFEALDDPKRKSALGMNIGDTSLESMLENRPSSLEVSEGRYSPFQAPIPSPLPLFLQEKKETFTLSAPPHISFVPPTPSADDTPEPHTPPHAMTGSSTSTATLGADLDGSLRSVGSTPSTPGTPKEKRFRSGSVSMLQRAAGLVRKKSEEKVKEKDKDRDETGETSAATTTSKLSWGRSSESTAHSHTSSHAPGLGHSISFPSAGAKLTKSPPIGKGKEREFDHGHKVTSALTPESPWTSVESASPQTPAQQPPQASRQVFKLASPAFLSTHVEDKPTETFLHDQALDDSSGSKGRAQRASIFNAFRFWFQEDRKKSKGKGKATASPLKQSYINAPPSTPTVRSRGGPYKGSKKRNNGFGHSKRPSVSSRRSSSVNSRRSSLTSNPPRRPSDFILPQPLSPDSMHHISRQRSDASRRSMGSRTPSSEVGSRPSSVRSFNRTPRARPTRARSPSQSSTGSSRTRQPTSPMFHRRLGSGSSSRVVRQVHLAHNRNHSQASSARSSRRGSLDVPGVTASSPEMLDLVDRLGGERSITPSRERKQGTTVFVAHKQSNVFGAPSARLATIGRTSWKKSWGIEPPSWQSRAAHAPVETFSDPGHGGSLRDVFSGRQSLDPNDEDEWEDEDDDMAAFVGGLGQLPAISIPGMTSSSASTSSGLPPSPSLRSKHELPPLMGVKTRTVVVGKRHRPISAPVPPKASLQVDSSATRSATLRASPTPPILPLAAEPNTGSVETAHHGPASRPWRPMQGGRAGPAFKHPIQEEDEDEE